MQKLLSPMRKAIQDYEMIKNGDVVAVGVSGGKDSMAMLAGLAYLRKFIGIDYKLHAIVIDMGHKDYRADYGPLQKFCDEIDVPLHIKYTEIGHVIFDIRKESNPCALCARMRRGSLHDAAKEIGCNVLALGHHKDDAIETFFMNLFNEGRIGCFRPVTYLSRKEITAIRPMILCDESLITSTVKRLQIPVQKSGCPADGVTNREKTKQYLSDMEYRDRGFKERIFGAMKRAHLDGLN